MDRNATRTSPSSSTPTLSPLRMQAAVVRALVDELDDRAPIESDPALVAQLADELGRLGRDALQAAAELSRRGTPRFVRRFDMHEAAEEDLDPIPMRLPLVAF